MRRLAQVRHHQLKSVGSESTLRQRKKQEHKVYVHMHNNTTHKLDRHATVEAKVYGHSTVDLMSACFSLYNGHFGLKPLCGTFHLINIVKHSIYLIAGGFLLVNNTSKAGHTLFFECAKIIIKSPKENPSSRWRCSDCRGR